MFLCYDFGKKPVIMYDFKKKRKKSLLDITPAGPGDPGLLMIKLYFTDEPQKSTACFTFLNLSCAFC